MSLIARLAIPRRRFIVLVCSIGLPGVPLGRAAAAPPGFGHPLTGLTPAELAAFEEGKEEFEAEEGVDEGVGPVFNATSCVACHASPAVGGDSTVVETRFGTRDKKKFDPLISGGGSLIQAH